MIITILIIHIKIMVIHVLQHLILLIPVIPVKKSSTKVNKLFTVHLTISLQLKPDRDVKTASGHGVILDYLVLLIRQVADGADYVHLP